MKSSFATDNIKFQWFQSKYDSIYELDAALEWDIDFIESVDGIFGININPTKLVISYEVESEDDRLEIQEVNLKNYSFQHELTKKNCISPELIVINDHDNELFIQY